MSKAQRVKPENSEGQLLGRGECPRTHTNRLLSCKGEPLLVKGVAISSNLLSVTPLPSCFSHTSFSLCKNRMKINLGAGSFWNELTLEGQWGL